MKFSAAGLNLLPEFGLDLGLGLGLRSALDLGSEVVDDTCGLTFVVEIGRVSGVDGRLILGRGGATGVFDVVCGAGVLGRSAETVVPLIF